MKPELELTDRERADLFALIQYPGFLVFHKLVNSVIDQFNLALVNANPANREEVLAAHTMMKAAAQVWAGIVNRYNNELDVYESGVQKTPEPDRTEELYN